MFRHVGKSRTHQHNVKIASLLSLVAGLVNVVGFLSVHQLTTNVTGHFAFFMDEMLGLKFGAAFVYFLYIFFFICGSFFSSYLIEAVLRRNEKKIFDIPIILESGILFLIALCGNMLTEKHAAIIACALLFSMGLQNSLVTQISGSIVRTTHLTGLFTDLGIELSQLFFFKTAQQQKKLRSSIQLRFIIMLSFFSGGVIGGLCYQKIGLYTLLLATCMLIAGLSFDLIRFKLLALKRRSKTREN